MSNSRTYRSWGDSEHDFLLGENNVYISMHL